MQHGGNMKLVPLNVCLFFWTGQHVDEDDYGALVEQY